MSSKKTRATEWRLVETGTRTIEKVVHEAICQPEYRLPDVSATPPIVLSAEILPGHALV